MYDAECVGLSPWSEDLLHLKNRPKSRRWMALIVFDWHAAESIKKSQQFIFWVYSTKNTYLVKSTHEKIRWFRFFKTILKSFIIDTIYVGENKGLIQENGYVWNRYIFENIAYIWVNFFT